MPDPTVTTTIHAAKTERLPSWVYAWLEKTFIDEGGYPCTPYLLVSHKVRATTSEPAGSTGQSRVGLSTLESQDIRFLLASHVAASKLSDSGQEAKQRELLEMEAEKRLEEVISRAMARDLKLKNEAAQIARMRRLAETYSKSTSGVEEVYTDEEEQAKDDETTDSGMRHESQGRSKRARTEN